MTTPRTPKHLRRRNVGQRNMLRDVIRLAEKMQRRMDGAVVDLVFIGPKPPRKPACSQKIEHMVELAERTTRRRA